PLRAWGHVSIGLVDRASVRWGVVGRRAVCCGLRCLGIRLLRLRRVRPLSRDERAGGEESIALPCPGGRGANRRGGALHPRPAGSAAALDHAHSWGSIPAGRFAGAHPALVDRLVLFGPVARRPPRRYAKPPSAPAWQMVTLETQWARFTEDVPAHEPPVLSRAHFEAWGERYLGSDPDSRRHDPVGVKIPTGPFNDIIHAWHGELAYDPALVH